MIGAPKCGTSSLFNQLLLHPQIVGTDPKETFALLSPGHPLSNGRRYHSIADLQNSIPVGNFDSAENPSILLEGTTHHLYSENAAQAVATVGDQARVIVMLRQPAKRVHSSFKYTQQNLARIPKSLSFHNYVDLLLNDQQDVIRQQINHPASSAVLSMDLHYSNYERYLKHWFDVVGQEKIRVVIAEEYFKDPVATATQVHHWLNLQDLPAEQQQSKRRNETRAIGSPVVHRMAHRLNQLFPGARLLKPVKKMYFQIQRSFSAPEQENVTESMEKLNRHFEPQIRSLSALLDLDLSVWD